MLPLEFCLLLTACLPTKHGTIYEVVGGLIRSISCPSIPTCIMVLTACHSDISLLGRHQTRRGLFTQSLDDSDNAYVFPPFSMIGPVLHFLFSAGCNFTIVLPNMFPRRFWWPLVNGHAQDKVRLGEKAQSEVLLFPTRAGPFAYRPLDWDLWAFRVQVVSGCSQPPLLCLRDSSGSPVFLPSTKTLQLDLKAIDKRIEELQSARISTPYGHQKSHLEVELQSFLATLFPPKSPFSCAPKDVIRFLVWKDQKG